MVSVLVFANTGGGSPLCYESPLVGGGIVFVVVEGIASWHGGYLIMRVSSASWVAEVAWHEYIRLCSGNAS
jgi:hypothetical protein